MNKKQFWTGFAIGSAATLGGAWAFGLAGRGGRSRILRLEKSVQIGRSLEDVFQTWCDLEALPRYTSLLRRVTRTGDSSQWVAEIAGRPVEWRAELEQVLLNQSIGWRSVSGLRHSGRVTFSPIGDQTLVHVQMNYAPHPWFLRPLFSPMTGMLEGYIEQGLRDLKMALESGRGKTTAQKESAEPAEATGTYGPTAPNPRFGAPTIPVEFTAAPDAKR